MTSADDVGAIVGALEAAGIRSWIGGGWGVDALVGEQTRDHQDLDLALAAEDESRVVGVLEGQGFRMTLDERPGRVELSDRRGRRVDVHLLVFGDDGTAVQRQPDGSLYHYEASGFGGSGRVAGRKVACLTAEQNAAFRRGYEHGDVDVHDLRLLYERFGVSPKAVRNTSAQRAASS
jgi:lincosamide nucleotidyltransferase A/C/D/E